MDWMKQKYMIKSLLMGRKPNKAIHAELSQVISANYVMIDGCKTLRPSGQSGKLLSG
jgi:hypothetical protein